MVLVLSALLHLKSRQVDYTQAFPEVPHDDNVFMQIPQGSSLIQHLQNLISTSANDPQFIDKEHFIRLKHNLYSIKQAVRNRFLHLKNGLLGHKFKQSKIDPCLFIHNDCLLASTPMIVSCSPRMITKLCISLSTEFLLKDEGSIKNFLSINNIVHRLKDDGSITIKMTQMGLIDQILKDMGLVLSAIKSHRRRILLLQLID